MSIRVNNVTMTFRNKVTAVDHVNLEIPNGIFGLLGENGAGKTTLMRILTTVYKPTDGTVSLDGMLYCEGNYEKIQRKIGYLPQEIDLYPNLTAAIAHDIRSPLSVLKGYQEMLIEYVPDNTIDMDKTMEMLHAGMQQIERMDVFVETMRKMSSLESREIQRVDITAGELRADIQAEVGILAKDKKVLVEVPKTEEKFMGDKEVVLEVVENILSNALRYARFLVKIEVHLTNQELRICVTDDGGGFKESPEKIKEPYFQQNVKDSLNHSGLGMYISRLYCERHGGKLLLENDAQGGAKVTAVFR